MHPFDLIYEAALEKNAAKLASIPRRILSTDVTKVGVQGTPFTLLAKDNDIESLEFLKVNNVYSSPEYIAYGYALGGHITNANNILKSAPDYSRADIISHLGSAYAQKNISQGIGLILKLIQQENELNYLYDSAAYGYALKGIGFKDILLRISSIMDKDVKEKIFILQLHSDMHEDCMQLH